MRLLANENFPADAVLALREAGYDVLWIRETAPGIADPEVLARAVQAERILLTFDKDFGELAYRAGLPASCGIILLHILMPSSTYVAKLALEALNSRQDWAGHFSVIEEHRIRNIVVDSGSLIVLFDGSDQYNDQAVRFIKNTRQLVYQLGGHYRNRVHAGFFHAGAV